MLRSEIKEQTGLGKQAQAMIEAGELVPDSLVDAIVRARLEAEDARHGFILDGYPRTTRQAEVFEKLAAHECIDTLAIGIIVEDEVLIARLSGRRNCPKCGRIYNTGSNSSRKEGVCNDCGAGLTQRSDDRPEVVRERLQVYHQTTQPLIEHYQRRRQYVEVDGTGSADQIFDTIVEIVNGEKENRTASH
jgi:adenylate kinase